MKRREILKAMATMGAASLLPFSLSDTASAQTSDRKSRWVTPKDPGWPSAAEWDSLRQHVGGRLIAVQSPLQSCAVGQSDAACAELFTKDLTNPYFIGDNVALTQTLGWVDAWQSMPSVYAVAAENAQDVAAAVSFARQHRLRLVVKGGGHSYHGTSNAADSLLVWTKHMHATELHEAFVGQGCVDHVRPQPAISLGAGTIWAQAYDAAITRGNRYVQGGGCMTVGVAGLVQSGGFGSFSKKFGTAGSGLLEAEIVTADGKVRIANQCTNPELYWALKGGGGGNYGVVTRVTLKTHDLPEYFGAVIASIEAKSDAAFRRLIDRVLAFYQTDLLNSTWGEQLGFGPGNRLSILMVFQGISKEQAEKVWRSFFDWVQSAAQDYSMEPPTTLAIPARHFWDPATLRAIPGIVRSDSRPDAPLGNVFWSGDADQAGQFLHEMSSTWLPASLLREDKRASLAESLFAISRTVSIQLHCNKGLAGASDEVLEAARATPMNPIVTEAFALAICARAESPAYPGIKGHEPNVAAGRVNREKVQAAIALLRKLPGVSGSYVSESDFFETDWPQAYWGSNYARLKGVKGTYDPADLFTVHHGVAAP